MGSKFLSFDKPLIKGYTSPKYSSVLSLGRFKNLGLTNKSYQRYWTTTSDFHQVILEFQVTTSDDKMK